MPPSPARPKNSYRRFAERAGRRGEFWAGLLLRLKGYRILARRVKTPVGEIDLIARRGGLTVFVARRRRPPPHRPRRAVLAGAPSGRGGRRLPLRRDFPCALRPAAPHRQRLRRHRIMT
jgi:hypothetical protein